MAGDAEGNLGDEDDAEDDGHGDLDGGEAGGEGHAEVAADGVEGCPEDASSRHQREDAADEEHGNGALLPHRTAAREEGHGDGGHARCHDHR